MAYTPTKTHYFIGLLILVGIVLFSGWMWGGWFKSDTPTPPKANGSPCTVKKNGVDVQGTITNGVCYPTGGPGGPTGGAMGM